MRKPPAFQFYVKDWRSSPTVRSMTRAQRGDFIEMLAASWDQDEPGTLPLPVELSAKIVGILPSVFISFRKRFPKIWQEIDGKLVNPKLREQWLELQQRQQKLSDAGKLGNERRWEKTSGGESGGESGGNRSASALAFAPASEKKEQRTVNLARSMPVENEEKQENPLLETTKPEPPDLGKTIKKTLDHLFKTAAAGMEIPRVNKSAAEYEQVRQKYHRQVEEMKKSKPELFQ